MDSTDRQIIKTLQINGRVTNQELAFYPTHKTA